ncbi:hypothetical protein CC80DRAFT_571292 [Byssothecium circinans]|uniref:Uncharacterized protein n=1 Tax=Byssothecium circinans TaxID=147558 RepID=A0A6A5TJ77_9PLEO|nr:hypothetical protein CC80DRAFT_571292 [Byssothecium circinans]
MFVLANPNENGVCEAIPCHARDVFFAPEYRVDSVTQKHNRRRDWLTLVREAVERVSLEAQSKKARPNVYTDIMPTPPPLSLALKVRRCLQDHRTSSSVEALDQAIGYLQELDLDLKDSPDSTSILARLVNTSRPFSIIDAQAAVPVIEASLKSSKLTSDTS